MKVIKRIFSAVMTLSTLAAVIAFVSERRDKSRREHKPHGLYEQYVKRPLDAFLSTAALILCSPLMLLTAALVRVKLGSPVLFTQERPGRDGKIFKLFKFRTMTDQRDENGELLPDHVRLTPFGEALRASSLDELPELINIARGDMSLIGPRPLLVQYLPYYTPTEQHRHDVRPGLSGLAQVNGRNLIDWDQRLAYDVQYVNNISFMTDVKIILQTVKKVFAREDIAADTVTVEPYLDEERRARESK